MVVLSEDVIVSVGGVEREGEREKERKREYNGEHGDKRYLSSKDLLPGVCALRSTKF